MDKRKAELTLGINNIRERRRPLLFTAPADSWLAHRDCHMKDSNNQRVPQLWGVDLTRPMSQWSYNAAFKAVRAKAKVECRFYDGRHTFITRLAENPSVSIETVKQLAGHVDPRMLGRYAHIRVQARRDAIATLETPISGRERLQNSLQSADGDEPVIN